MCITRVSSDLTCLGAGDYLCVSSVASQTARSRPGLCRELCMLSGSSVSSHLYKYVFNTLRNIDEKTEADKWAFCFNGNGSPRVQTDHILLLVSHVSVAFK